MAGLWLLSVETVAAETGQDCENVPPEGGTDAFYEIVETAVLPSQLAEMVAGIGEIGVLADGSGRDSYELPEGVTVPAATGTQPLVYKPMGALAIPDNPGLLDELRERMGCIRMAITAAPRLWRDRLA